MMIRSIDDPGRCFRHGAGLRREWKRVACGRRDPRLASLASLVLAATVACGGDPGGTGTSPLPPVLTSVSPSTGMAGAESLVLTVSGENFRQNSQIVFDASPIPTVFLSETGLRGTLNAGQLALADTHLIQVRTPAPGAGESQLLSFTVMNPQPSINDVSPAFAVLRGGSFELTISGSGFVESSQVHWNAEWLTTTYVSSGMLTATVPENLLIEFQPVEVTVTNHPPGGGVAPAWSFEIRLDPAITSFVTTGLLANDVIHDAEGHVLYASISNRDSSIPNTVAMIDPETATVLATIQTGVDPGTLALSSDGRFLFVGLNGAPRVQRIDLLAQNVDRNIPLGELEFFGPYYAEDIACLPGEPLSFAVSRYFQGLGYGGVAVFDGTVQRPDEIDRFTGANRVEATDSADRIFGFNSRNSEYGLRELLVTEDGLAEGRMWTGLIDGVRGDIVFADGLIYGTNGAVIDAESGGVLGNMQLAGDGPVAPDPTADRVHYLALDFSPTTILTLQTFALSSFAPTGSAALPLAFDAPWKVVRWGSDGLAYVDGEGLTLLRTSLVGP